MFLAREALSFATKQAQSLLANSTKPAPAKEINMKIERFSFTHEQQAFVQSKMKEYILARKALKDVRNTALSAGSCIGLLSYCTLFYGALLSIGTVAAARYFFNLKYPSEAPTIYSHFRKAQKELLEIYQWMAKSGPQITHDPLTKEVLRTLAPDIVQTNDLIREEFWKEKGEIDARFLLELDGTRHELPSNVIGLIVGPEHLKQIREEYKKTVKEIPSQYSVGFFVQKLEQISDRMIFAYNSQSEQNDTVQSQRLG